MDGIDSVRIAWADVPDTQRVEMLDSWNSTGKLVPAKLDDNGYHQESTDNGYQLSDKRVGKDGKQQAGDRFRTLNAFVDATMRELTPSEKIVWFVLFREVRNGVANVAQGDIATRSGLTQSTVSQAIQRLKGRGLVRVVRQGGFRSGQSTYVIRGVL